MKKKVLVAMGGTSSEREVSLKTGAAVCDALTAMGHSVTSWDPADGIPQTRSAWDELICGQDVVFLALHGRFGEDGQLQSQLESLQIPFTGCGSTASSLAFDKVATKRKWREAGLLTADFVSFDSKETPFPDALGKPFVVKPACEGSSVGLYFVESQAEWSQAVEAILKLDRCGLAEQKIEGREITVGVLEGKALPIVEIRPRTGVYDYKNKYTAGATEYLCPAPFDAGLTEEIQRIGEKAFAAVGARDYARVDMIVTEERSPFLLEINTLPGMTETSLLPKAAQAAGISFKSLCNKMVEMAVYRSQAVK